MGELSIKQYNDKEANARLELCIRIIEAFQPALFEKVGYPHRIQHEAELFKYLDVMHEAEYFSNRSQEQPLLTENEFASFKSIAALTHQFSNEKFNKNAVAWTSLIGSLEVFRMIQYICLSEDAPTILEVGPGCGYLGVLLMSSGYPYAATEVSQALYLYQNHLWNYVFDSDIQETVLMGDDLKSIRESFKDSLRMHIPWWKFSRMWLEPMPEFDVVVCNRVLGEMHENSLDYLLKVANSFMSGKGRLKGFIFRGWGYSLMNRVDSMIGKFYRHGFVATVLNPEICMFVPLSTANTQGIHYYSYEAIEKCYQSVYKQSGKGEESRATYPSLQISPDTIIGKRILDCHENNRNNINVTLGDITKYCEELLLNKDISTMDAKFLEYIIPG